LDYDLSLLNDFAVNIGISTWIKIYPCRFDFKNSHLCILFKLFKNYLLGLLLLFFFILVE